MGWFSGKTKRSSYEKLLMSILADALYSPVCGSSLGHRISPSLAVEASLRSTAKIVRITLTAHTGRTRCNAAYPLPVVSAAALCGNRPLISTADLTDTTGMVPGTPKRNERRDSDRVIANFECLCSGSRGKGSGFLVDISDSGALMEEASFVPVRGELIGIAIEIPVAESGLLIGWVTRHTNKGFAIEFDVSSPQSKRLVKEIGAIVPADAKAGRRRK